MRDPVTALSSTKKAVTGSRTNFHVPTAFLLRTKDENFAGRQAVVYAKPVFLLPEYFCPQNYEHAQGRQAVGCSRPVFLSAK